MVWRVAVVLDIVKNLNKTSTFCDFENHEIPSKIGCCLFAQPNSDHLYSLKNIFHPYWLGKMELKRCQTSVFFGIEENSGKNNFKLSQAHIFCLSTFFYNVFFQTNIFFFKLIWEKNDI